MKKIVYVFVAVLFIFSTLQAHSVQAASEKIYHEFSLEAVAEIVTQRMKAEFSLTEDQIPAVKQVNLDNFNKIAEASKKFTMAQKKEFGLELINIIQSWEADLKSALTDAQYNTLVQKKEEIKNKIQAKFGAQCSNFKNKYRDMTPEEKAEKKTNRMKTELSLTGDQVPQVKQINLDRYTKIADASEKYTMDQFMEFGQEQKSIHKKWTADLKAVLTEDQYNTFIQNREEQKKKIQKKCSGSSGANARVHHGKAGKKYGSVKVNISPNPSASGIYTISAGENIDGIIISDVMGNIIKEDYQISSSEYTIDLSGKQTGIYNITVISGEKKTVTKLVKN